MNNRPKIAQGTLKDPVNRSRSWYRLNAATRLAIIRGANRPFSRNLIVNEFPKSGGSWVSQMLAQVTGLPFPRQQFPLLRSCIMQCHVLNPLGMRNVVIVWRDGRDVMVSFYHHLVIGHSEASARLTERVQRELDIQDKFDVRENLPRFIERVMTSPFTPGFTWPQFVEAWADRSDVAHTKFEDMLVDPCGEVMRLSENFLGYRPSAKLIQRVVEDHSFVSQSGRKPGDENATSFLRKGISGDWENHFSSEAVEVFNHYAGGAMRNLGYGK